MAAHAAGDDDAHLWVIDPPLDYETLIGQNRYQHAINVTLHIQFVLVTLLYTTLCLLLMWSSSWVDHERTNLLLIINILLGSSATLQLFLFF